MVGCGDIGEITGLAMGRLVASLVVQFGGTTLEKVFLVATLGLGKENLVDMGCVSIDWEHIVQNDIYVLCRIANIFVSVLVMVKRTLL